MDNWKDSAVSERHIYKAKKKVNNVFLIFKEAYDALKEANDRLDKAVKHSDDRITWLEADLAREKSTRQRALQEIEENNRLRANLESNFIKKEG